MTETMANGYSYDSTRRELPNEYHHNRVKMIFAIFCFFVHWTKVTSAAEGIRDVKLVINTYESLESRPAVVEATGSQVQLIMSGYMPGEAGLTSTNVHFIHDIDRWVNKKWHVSVGLQLLN